MNQYRIPRFGNAKTSILGATRLEFWGIFVPMCVVSFALMSKHTLYGIGLLFASWSLMKIYVSTKLSSPLGHYKSLLYGWGLTRYGKGFKRHDKVWIGDHKAGIAAKIYVQGDHH